MGNKRRLIIGITGASGVIYGIRLLEVLSYYMSSIEKHVILSNSAKKNIKIETNYKISEIEEMADVLHDFRDIGSSIASGSFLTEGMVIIPCTIKTMSAIANSYNDNLIVRAADVCLKERRRLILVVRETPLHLGHLRTMVNLTEMGAIIFPPVPSFYHFPKTINDIIDQTVGKVLDLFNIHIDLFNRWGESKKEEIKFN